jgi:hypothetical protein
MTIVTDFKSINARCRELGHSDVLAPQTKKAAPLVCVRCNGLGWEPSRRSGIVCRACGNPLGYESPFK